MEQDPFKLDAHGLLDNESKTEMKADESKVKKEVMTILSTSQIVWSVCAIISQVRTTAQCNRSLEEACTKRNAHFLLIAC